MISAFAITLYFVQVETSLNLLVAITFDAIFPLLVDNA